MSDTRNRVEQTKEYDRGFETSQKGITKNSKFVINYSTPEAMPDEGANALKRMYPVTGGLVPCSLEDTNPVNYSK